VLGVEKSRLGVELTVHWSETLLFGGPGLEHQARNQFVITMSAVAIKNDMSQPSSLESRELLFHEPFLRNWKRTV